MKGTTGSPRMARSAALRATFVLTASLLAPAIGLVIGGCGAGEASGGRHPDQRPAARRARGGAPPDYRAALRGAPPPLAALYRHGDDLLDGGTAAYRSRLRAL